MELGIISDGCGVSGFRFPKGYVILSQVTPVTRTRGFFCNLVRGQLSSLSIIFGNSKKPVSHWSSLPKKGVEFNFLEIIKNIAHILFSKAWDIILAMCKE